jgi:hypothetical protein
MHEYYASRAVATCKYSARPLARLVVELAVDHTFVHGAKTVQCPVLMLRLCLVLLCSAFLLGISKLWCCANKCNNKISVFHSGRGSLSQDSQTQTTLSQRELGLDHSSSCRYSWLLIPRIGLTLTARGFPAQCMLLQGTCYGPCCVQQQPANVCIAV